MFLKFFKLMQCLNTSESINKNFFFLSVHIGRNEKYKERNGTCIYNDTNYYIDESQGIHQIYELHKHQGCGQHKEYKGKLLLGVSFNVLHRIMTNFLL